MGEKKFNREWVKTFAIIFFHVLLVLTCFYQMSIMNMTSSGSIYRVHTVWNNKNTGERFRYR